MLYWKQIKSNKLSEINFLALDLQFFAKKKGGGAASTNCNHDSNSKSRGVKKFGGELITKAGSIIVRQLGSKFRAGNNVHLGKDFTLHASCEGIVKYYQKKVRGKNKSFVEIIKKE